MKRLPIVMLVVFMLPTLCIAQNNEQQAKSQISDVLKNEESYLYADQTCATAEQALQKAQEILNREIEAYLGQSADEAEIVKGTVTGDVVSVTVTRGDKYRAFVYIKKSGLLGNKEQRQPETALPEEPQQQPHEELGYSTPANKTTEKQPNPIEPSASVAQESNALGALLEPILSMTRKNQVYDYINMLKKDGDEAEWVAQPYALSNFKDIYLVLYRRDGSIEAVLSPVGEDGQRINIKTGQNDSRLNHPSTSINGFIIK